MQSTFNLEPSICCAARQRLAAASFAICHPSERQAGEVKSETWGRLATLLAQCCSPRRGRTYAPCGGRLCADLLGPDAPGKQTTTVRARHAQRLSPAASQRARALWDLSQHKAWRHLVVHNAMCFGAAASVWNFNRVADALQQLIRTLFLTPLGHFVDDFNGAEDERTAESGFAAVGKLFDLLGFHHPRHSHPTTSRWFRESSSSCLQKE